MQAENSPENYYNKGINEFDEGQYELSIENFKKAIELDDQNFDYYYNLGVAYIKTEEYDLAIENFNKGIELNAKDADLYLNLGLAFYNKGEFQKAAKAYNKAVWINSTEPEHFSNAGIAYCALKNYKEAIFNFKQAVKLEPKNESYNYNLAYAYFEFEKYELAEEFLVNVVYYNRQNEDAYFLLGKVYIKQYDYELAKDNFQKVLNLNPDHEEAKIAIEEINNRKANKAKNKDIAEAVAVQPEPEPEPAPEPEPEPEAVLSEEEIEIKIEDLLNTATELLENKEYEAAIVEFKKILKLKENHPQVLESIDIAIKQLNEAKILFTQGLKLFAKNEFALSIEYLEKGLAIYPHNEKINKILDKAISKNEEVSQAYIESGQYEQAIESLKTTLEKNPNDSKAHLNLGNVYIEQEEYDLALGSLRNTLNIDPENKEAKDAVWAVIKELNTRSDEISDHLRLSLIHINKKQYSSAKALLEKVLGADPDNSDAKTLLVKIKDLELSDKSESKSN